MTKQIPSFMRRASVSRGSRGWILSTSDRRELLAAQAEADKQVFDASLGLPLTSFEHLTLDLAGGKALQCWRLAKHGFPVPTSFAIPTYVYNRHIAEAGVAILIHQVFANPEDEKAESKLKEIRSKIKSTPLSMDVVENLHKFLQSLSPGSFLAVRSSGSAEDLASQSFAGQYDSFLYKQTQDEIVESIKACWASMFKTHILQYLNNSDATSSVPPQPPKMGVLIMKMVEAEASGVCFTRNIWGDAKDAMIEAVLGQGEGLVSGDITPDRYVVDKLSSKVRYSELAEQTQKYVRANNEEGVAKVDLGDACEGPVMTASGLQRLVGLARDIEGFYNRPQDIEWAMDQSGDIFVLQSRDITTKDPSSLGFLPPGEGFWTFDPTHFPLPLSPWMQNYSFEYYTNNSRRIGCLIKSIKVQFVHGFAFTQPELFHPSDMGKLERAASAYWSKNLYEDDYREFTDFFRSDCEELQESLHAVNPSALSHNALLEHVAECYDSSLEFWKLHHTYSAPTMLVVGDYMNRMAKLTGKDEMETLVLLEAASPESRGILNKDDPLLAKMYNLLKTSAGAVDLLRCSENMASWALDCLLHMPGELGNVMQKVALQYGWRLAGGYDLVVPTLIETPNFFLKTILQGVEEADNAAELSRARVEGVCSKWRSALDEDKRTEFDTILDVGRRFFRIRDERGLATDLSGVGLCRRGILEAGTRLTNAGVLNAPDHLCCATKEEALALLTGDLGRLSRDKAAVGPISVPTAAELEQRFLHIKNADPNSVPRTLGVAPPPPPDAPLPPGIARTMAALDSALLRGVWDEGTGNAEDDVKANKNKVKGLSASMGKVTGPVCLVTKDKDLQNVKKGDIIVTFSSSASFNVVIGLAAGIVTDFGGMLSHAAIVSREYGIPAIVGTQDATSKFKKDDIVCIDTTKSTVERVEQMDGLDR